MKACNNEGNPRATRRKLVDVAFAEVSRRRRPSADRERGEESNFKILSMLDDENSDEDGDARELRTRNGIACPNYILLIATFT